jgi:mycothiol synthase
MGVAMVQIRPLKPDEYDQVVALRNSEKLFPRLPDALMHSWDLAPDYVPKAFWAIEVEGKLAGSAGYAMADAAPELWFIGIIVWPEYRRRGIGGQVYNALFEELRPRGARRFLTKIYTNQLDGLRFVARRGFREIGGSINCQLNVAAAEIGDRANPDEIVANQNLNFAMLNQFPRYDLAERLLPIWNRTRPDEPQYWPYVPYDAPRFERELLAPNDVALQHSPCILTVEERIVAFSLNAHDADNRLFTIYSGVDPDLRRRKLATALKLKLIAHAQAHRIDFLAAENEVSNKAMWGINQRLGYRRLLELVVYQKILAE